MGATIENFTEAKRRIPVPAWQSLRVRRKVRLSGFFTPLQNRSEYPVVKRLKSLTLGR
jgi:hypothetical protein